MDVKLVKIPSLAALQVAKYMSIWEQWSNVHEPLTTRTYLRKKLFFNFLGADFVRPKSGHQREKQPVLGLDQYQFKTILHLSM